MLPVTPKLNYTKQLTSTTLRSFSGGWNVIDDDMNLAPAFSVKAKNIFFDTNGCAQVRYGCKLFANCASYFSVPNVSIVNAEYFSAAIIAVGSNGEIVRVFGDGTVVRIWDTATAATLPGTPSAWSATEFVSFAQFNGHLIVCNGVDKPLDINTELEVDYLQDAATLTNINVPVCRYVVSASRYLIMTGDPVEPNRIHISARDAAGTWFGDPPPNDATRVDVGSVLANASQIRGVLSFRGKLIVMFAEGLVIGTLGIYDADSNHTPDFNDSIEDYGSMSHRAAVARGDDAVFLDQVGVPSIRRTVLSQAFKPERVSPLIDPEISAATAILTDVAIEDRTFCVYDKREGQFMLFIPNSSDRSMTTETVGFIWAYRPSLKQESWSEFRGWNWTAACRSLSGNIFFADADAKIWLYGNRDTPITADFIDLVSSYDGPDYDPVGVGIDFEWELPWLDMRAKDKNKNSKYISFDTRGSAEFTCDMYVDNYSTVSLSTGFSGGSQGSFGAGPQPFGGGRNTQYKKLYAWPAKFQMAKLRLYGTVTEALKFVSITIQYQLGGIRR